MHRHGHVRQALVSSAVALFGAFAVLLIVGSSSLKKSEDFSVRYMLEQNPGKARFEELWFGPGITDDLNRMVKIGE